MVILILLTKNVLNSLARRERSAVGGSSTSLSLSKSLFVS